MNVMRPAAIKVAFYTVSLGVLFATCACAQTTVFMSTDKTIALTIESGVMTFRSNQQKIEKCSSVDYDCLKTETGFYAEFPKRCPSSEWFPENGLMQRVSSLPHSRGGEYANRPESPFRYLWDERDGLAAIEVVKADTSHSGTAWVPLFFSSGKILFKCK